MIVKTCLMLLHFFCISFLNTAERTSECRKMNGLSWSNVKKKKSRDKFTYFVIFFYFCSSSLFLFCHYFLSVSFAFLCTKACSFHLYEEFEETFLVKGKLHCVSAAHGWRWTSQALESTTLYPEACSQITPSHLTDKIGGAMNTLIVI